MRRESIFPFAFCVVLLFASIHGSITGQSPTQTTNAAPKHNPKAAGFKAGGTQPSTLGATAADSEQRFKLWLLMQAAANDVPNLPPIASVSSSPVPNSEEIRSLVKAIDQVGTASLISELHLEDWQAHIIWSWGDTGAMEPEVVRAVISIDSDYGKDMNGACILPGYDAVIKGKIGRQCIMQVYACDAAKSKFDTLAWKMTIATQMHNPAAVKSLNDAGPFNVAEFIRDNRGCR